MSSWDNAIDFVLESEGGLVDHPSDPGGLTNFGISQRAHRDVDIRNLDRAGAEAIYKNEYWHPCRCSTMPDAVALVVFDYAVNSGNRVATRALQRAVGVTADGTIGPVTLRAIRARDPLAVADKVIDQRLKNYVRIIRRKPSSMAFLTGWMRRLLHLTEAIR